MQRKAESPTVGAAKFMSDKWWQRMSFTIRVAMVLVIVGLGAMVLASAEYYLAGQNSLSAVEATQSSEAFKSSKGDLQWFAQPGLNP
jgi:hypothetical protein